MSFEVAAHAYGRFMGRFSEPLAGPFADLAWVTAPQRALDVGCGPGALTGELVRRLGAQDVSALDPSASFVAAAAARFPEATVVNGVAESLPFADDSFDVTLAQLVVHFMADPVLGLSQMARVTRPGGTIAACVWDHAGDHGPLRVYWRAVRDLDPAAEDESRLAGTQEHELPELLAAAGLTDVEPATLQVAVHFRDVDDWWEPYTLGVGPAGAHVATLDEDGREALRSRCAALLPSTDGFELTARAWAARGRAPGRSTARPVAD